MKNQKFFGENDEKWMWKDFQTTEDFPISEELMDWVIGQDKALEECKLCIDEWVEKLLNLKKKRWWKVFEPIEKIKSITIGRKRIKIKSKKVFGDKPPPKEWLPSGPFLLMIGDAGTGKSLIGRALATYMTKIYKKHGIELYDVVSHKNEVLPSEPKISIHQSPNGRKLVVKEKKEVVRKGFWKRSLIRGIQFVIGGLGALLLFIAFWFILVPWITNELIATAGGYIPIQIAYGGNFFKYFMNRMLAYFPLVMAGGNLLFLSIFISWIGRFIGRNTGMKGIGGAEATDAPKLIVDNSSGRAPFIDATGHSNAQLFGSIAWDPYQTGGLGTPEHQRVSAGDVHRAHLGILYIDEIKNLHGGEAVTLLTVLEDGQLPIALRGGWHGGDTAAMAVSTEPVPCMNFLVAAGNLDSVPQIHYALMDRIYGYGKVVYMNNDMPNTVENRRKYIQFIAQEAKRFNLLPFSREACIELINESSRKSGRIDKLTTKFRPMISVVKTASILALNEGKKTVGKVHVEEALKEHCKTIQLQVMEHHVDKVKAYRMVNPKAKPVKGQIHGLAVQAFERGGIGVGIMVPIRASVEKLNKYSDGYFRVTGVETEHGSWVQNSISKVTTIIQERYKHKKKVGIHIDFAQSIDVDGPSAGVAMALSLISIFDKKPIRQDTAVTGEINISVEDKIIITPVGGIREKILAAEKSGFKRVLIPKRNYELNVNQKDYKIKIIPCSTLEDYIKEILVNK